MAIFCLRASVIQRKNAQSSIGNLSYITAEKIKDERTNKVYHYGHSDRVAHVETIIPDYAPKEFSDMRKLFNGIETYEKKETACPAKKYWMALPKELNEEEHLEIIRDWIKENLTDKGYGCTFAIHQDKDNENPHVHILVANRQIDKDGFAKTKCRKEYALDEKGERIPLLDKDGNQKLGKRNEKLWKRVSVERNPLDDREVLICFRESWAKHCNRKLEPELQIDHRSYKARGINQIAQVHEGPKARARRKKGQRSYVCDYNDQIKAQNQILAAEQEKETALVEWKEEIDNDIERNRLTQEAGKFDRGMLRVERAVQDAGTETAEKRRRTAESERQNRDDERERLRIAEIERAERRLAIEAKYGEGPVR